MQFVFSGKKTTKNTQHYVFHRQPGGKIKDARQQLTSAVNKKKYENGHYHCSLGDNAEEVYRTICMMPINSGISVT